MTTPEAIARETAEELVKVGDWPTGQVWHVVIGGKLLPQHHNADYIAESHAGEVRGILRAAILSAIEKALMTVPVPGGLSEERLAEIHDWRSRRNGETPALNPRTLRRIDDLLAHINHLRRALHDCGQDGSAAVWAAGYEVGKKEMAEKVAAALVPRGIGWGLTTQAAINRARDVIADAATDAVEI